MDSFPIELIENILRFCDGYQFSQSCRVSTIWLKAKQNIERTDDSFWRNRCRLEIESNLIEDLNPYRKPLDLLEGHQCKEVYINWFRSQTIARRPNDFIEYSETFGSAFKGVENVTALTVSGTLVISGHRSGRILLIDVLNNMKPIEVSKHSDPVNDLVPINLVGEESYELYKRKPEDYPNEWPSYTSHHHIISIGEDSRINISLISDRNHGKTFQICPLTHRHFLKGRVCHDLFAVSTKEAVDISLFRLVLPDPGVVPIIKAIKAELITTISCRQVFNSANHWLGLFTFSNQKLSCFSHEFNLIACSDVAFNLALPNKDNFRWKWSSINELIYEYKIQSKDFIDYNGFSVKMLNGFSFGDQIFFLITNLNETVYTTDAKTFHLCDLSHWLTKTDRVMALCLFGSVLACGTANGFVYVHKCPNLNRLKYISHYKPLFSERICKDPILKINISDTGMGPIVAAATKHKIYFVKWFSQPNHSIQSDLKSRSQLITID